MDRNWLRWVAGAVISLSCVTAGFAEGSLELISEVAPSQVSGTGAGSTFNSVYYVLFRPSLSNDGRYVVFQSYETNLVSGERDLNQDLDLYVQDLLTGTTSLVSHTADSPVTTANQPSYGAVISGDGRWVAFTSRATDLVPGLPPKPVEPPSSSGALYLYDRTTGVTTMVTNAPPHDFYGLAISGDGRWIAFISRARRLVPGQQGAGYNVFLYDREAGSFRLVSHTAASPTTGGGSSSRYPLFSADGRWLVFLSFADLAPGKPPGDTAYLYDMTSGEVTAAGYSGFMALSADGRYLAVHGSWGATSTIA
jgi:Tol biopolymer transport system component